MKNKKKPETVSMKGCATSTSTQEHTSVHIAEEQDGREQHISIAFDIFWRHIKFMKSVSFSRIDLAVAPARLTTTPGGLIFTGHTSVLQN